MVGANFSQETTQQVMEMYEARIDALLYNIEYLKNQLEKNNI